MKALTFFVFGGPEVLEYIDIPEPVVKQDELIGANESHWFKLC
jgi:NADPH:quinone reductase-like Zn-dependent oxidoreductase